MKIKNLLILGGWIFILTLSGCSSNAASTSVEIDFNHLVLEDFEHFDLENIRQPNFRNTFIPVLNLSGDRIVFLQKLGPTMPKYRIDNNSTNVICFNTKTKKIEQYYSIPIISLRNFEKFSIQNENKIFCVMEQGDHMGNSQGNVVGEYDLKNQGYKSYPINNLPFNESNSYLCEIDEKIFAIGNEMKQSDDIIRNVIIFDKENGAMKTILTRSYNPVTQIGNAVSGISVANQSLYVLERNMVNDHVTNYINRYDFEGNLLNEKAIPTTTSDEIKPINYFGNKSFFVFKEFAFIRNTMGDDYLLNLSNDQLNKLEGDVYLGGYLGSYENYLLFSFYHEKDHTLTIQIVNPSNMKENRFTMNVDNGGDTMTTCTAQMYKNGLFISKHSPLYDDEGKVRYYKIDYYILADIVQQFVESNI